MITGYNTDVRHGEVVFHVQTEDKGISNPFIESLVYVGGQVLATKRASYAELLTGGKDEKEIVAFMDHQHRTMIAAIRHGKLDSKLAALGASRQTSEQTAAGVLAAAKEMPPPPPAKQEPGETIARAATIVATSASAAAAARPSAASKPASPERTLDQVILEYLTSEADQEQLVLLLEVGRDLTLGGHATLVLRASSSKSGQPVVGSQITVRMISTVLEPRVLAAGRTDDGGSLTLAFEIPHVNRGTSALIINAVSAIGRAELKHLL